MADKFLTDLSIPAGKTSVSLPILVLVQGSSAGRTGLTATNFSLAYCRQGGTSSGSVAVSDLAAVDSAFSAGGMKEIDATFMPGWYRFDIPDAAFASGADWVVISVVSADQIPAYIHVALPTLATLATAVTDDVIEAEDTITLQQAMSIILAAVAGRTTNGGLTFKTPDNAATRITAAVDASKNRTSITLNPSA